MDLVEPGDIEPGGIEPVLELHGELGKFLDAIESSSIDVQKAIQEGYDDPKKAGMISGAFTEHATLLSNCLDHLFDEESGYSDLDTAATAAFVLKTDDAKRVDFLRQLSGEDGDQDSSSFKYAYPEHNDTTKQVLELFMHFRDDHNSAQACADVLMQQHVNYMMEDINNFMETNFVKNKFKKSERRQEIKDRLIYVATTAAGVAIGTLAAKAIWRKK